MLENVVFIFADVRHGAPMLWWDKKFIRIPHAIRDKVAPSRDKVWLNQFVVVTESLFENLGTLDWRLNFHTVHHSLHITSFVKGSRGIDWVGVKFDSMDDWFKVHVNRETGYFFYTDMSDEPLILLGDLPKYLSRAFHVLLKKKCV